MPAKYSHYIKLKINDPFSILMIVVAIVEPLTTLPQIWDVWVEGNAKGVSPISWSCFAVAAYIWVIYGIKIKNIPVLISSILWATTETLVAIGVLIHR